MGLGQSSPAGYTALPTHQELKVGEGGLSLRGVRPLAGPTALFTAINILTLGIAGLLMRAQPKLKVKLTCVEVPLSEADLILLLPLGDEEEAGSGSGNGAAGGPASLIPISSIPAPVGLPSEFCCHPPRREGQPQHDSKSRLNDGSGGVIPGGKVHRYFFFRRQRFYWDENSGGFQKLDGLPPAPAVTLLTEGDKGLSGEQREQRWGVYGKNEIEVEVKGYFRLLVEEVINPFYLFQIFSVSLWVIDEYYYYANCVLIISALSICLSLRETRRQSRALRDMATASLSPTTTVRTPDGGEAVIDSRDLVPGDVILIPAEGCVLPCDAVLLSGACILNEAMLTGEATPLQKAALSPADQTIYTPDTHKRHTLFAGTTLIQTRYYSGGAVAALVVGTGFGTAKGDLVHSLLWPRVPSFKFYAEAIKWVLLLFALATIGMGYSLILYIRRGASLITTVVRVLDILTIVVPPALPAAMTVGTLYAQNRLKAKSIFCISPPRINFGGKLRLVCFDKTGTLTEEGLDLCCVVPLKEGSEFGEPVASPSDLGNESPLLRALATCHSLTHVKDRLVGDPLDLKMFAGTGWTLEEPQAGGEDDLTRFDLLTPTVVKNGNMEIGIIREFEFSPQLQRMSVVVRVLGEGQDQGMMVLYSKGAPEKIRALCDPATLPVNFDKVLDSFTVKGYRVLALGHRPLQHIKWHQVQRVHRDAVETNLAFCGFLVMENSLKPATVGVIEELIGAGVRSVMVTGDNMLTALSVARECKIISPSDKVLVVEINAGGELEFRLAAEHCEEGEESYHHHSHHSHHLPPSRQCSTVSSEMGLDMEGLVSISEGALPITQTMIQLVESDYACVLTGGTWAALMEKTDSQTMERILAKVAVCARMAPEHKAQLVERLQGMGYVVGFCGDGANDCSALKAAHVGVSLSEAEASVAAPFTSKIPDISCVPEVIREGRGALSTSFGIFKYMALYSLVQFTSVITLYTRETNLADTQFLYIDLGITTTMAIVMGRTEPARRLHPTTPSASLLSPQNICTLFAQVLVCMGAQLGGLALLDAQSWYTPVTPLSPDDLHTLCWESTTIFSVSAFQYLILALALSKGPPFKKPFYTNRIFVLSLILFVSFTLVLGVWPIPPLASFFSLIPFHEDSLTFRLRLLAFPLANLIISLLLERPWAYKAVKAVRRFLRRAPPQKATYKIILKELEEDSSWPPLIFSKGP